MEPWIYIAVKALDLTWVKVSSFTLQLTAAAYPNTAKLVLKQGRVGGGMARQKLPLPALMWTSLCCPASGTAGGICAMGEVQVWCRKVQICAVVRVWEEL